MSAYATNDINPMNSFLLRHAKALAFVATESIHNVLFHFIETVKVRGQARNLKGGDVSHYFKNQVEKKPLISGIISGFLGAATGGLAFMTMHNYLTIQLYCNQVGLGQGRNRQAEGSKFLQHLQGWDFRAKNILIYAASDFVGSFAKVQFEVRKQLIQMWTKDASLTHIANATKAAWFPLMMRDVTFRAIILTSFYATTDVEHNPIQKYSMPQIVDFMKQRRELNTARGEPLETHQQLSHMFFEFHNYEIKTKITTRLIQMLFANLVGTLITNPFDVVLTKLATQQLLPPDETGKRKMKYSGFWNCLTTVHKEEGWRKLWLGGLHPRFMFNWFNGIMFLFIYDRYVASLNDFRAE